VFDIRIPPLRERADDILPLSAAFLQEISQAFGRPPASLTVRARDAILRHEWRGNVRELRNALERAAIVCDGNLIQLEDLALRNGGATSSTPAVPLPAANNLGVIERDTIARVLQATHWNKSKAATRLGLSRAQLDTRMRKHGLVRQVPYI
jgi:DNA-binding NtrC family response regulator